MIPRTSSPVRFSWLPASAGLPIGGRYALRLLTSMALALSLSATSFAANSLKLDREAYHPGDTITVRFAATDLASDSWAGIIPSQIPHGSEAENDRHDISYQYLKDTTSGTFTFKAPSTPGSYDVRLNDSDSNGRELASVTFEVRAPDLAAASLSLAKKAFIPGEAITLRFEAPEGLPRDAWVGIVPASIPHGDEAVNDRHDLAFQYLERKVRGTLDFVAPAGSGSYDFRLHDTDSSGGEIASARFEVIEHVNADLIAEQLTARGRVPLYGIRFASGKASVDESSATALAAVGDLLLRDRTLRLRIDGHTDDRGNADFNQTLSQRRADAVRTYLIDVFKIDPARLSTAGLGDNSPVAANDTEAGRAQNRRVELVSR